MVNSTTGNKMDFDAIKQLELELNNPKVRKNKARLNELLADNFEEVGKSGNKFTKDEIIRNLLEEENTDFSAHDFSFELLSEDCVLVKYTTTLNGQSAHRCSIWKKQQSNWQIHYHQGTPFAGAT